MIRAALSTLRAVVSGLAVPLQLTLLAVASVLAAVLELMFQYAYVGPIALPMGTLVILLTMPWLVRTTVEVLPSIPAAAAPVVLWFLATLVGFVPFGLDGALVAATHWQTLLLFATGVLVGLVCFRRAVDRLVAEAAERDARPLDPRIR